MTELTIDEKKEIINQMIDTIIRMTRIKNEERYWFKFSIYARESVNNVLFGLMFKSHRIYKNPFIASKIISIVLENLELRDDVTIVAKDFFTAADISDIPLNKSFSLVLGNRGEIVGEVLRLLNYEINKRISNHNGKESKSVVQSYESKTFLAEELT